MIKQQDQIPVAVPSTLVVIPEKVWKTIWNLQIPQKIKIFLWKAVQNILPVKDNMARRHISPSRTYPLCNLDAKTTKHTLFLCSWTHPVWFGLQIQCIPTPSKVNSFGNWLGQKFMVIQQIPETSQFGLISLACALWTIWKSRNQGVFGTVKINPMSTLVQTNVLISDYVGFANSTSRGNPQQVRSGFSISRWRPSVRGVLKINTDANVQIHRNLSVSGVVIRDDRGKLLSGLTRKHRVSSSLIAEGLTLRDGIALASSLGLDKIVLESGSLELIQTCMKEIMRGDISAIVRDIWNLQRSFSHCGFTWVNSQGNELAHFVASLAVRDALPSNWVYNNPPSIESFIDGDNQASQHSVLETPGLIAFG